MKFCFLFEVSSPAIPSPNENLKNSPSPSFSPLPPPWFWKISVPPGFCWLQKSSPPLHKGWGSRYEKESHICVWNVTRKATGFNSLRVNCWEINQVTSKCKMDYFDKACKKRSKTEKVNITIKSYIFKTV